MSGPRILVGDRHDVRVGRHEDTGREWPVHPAYRPDPDPGSMGLGRPGRLFFLVSGAIVALAVVALVIFNVWRSIHAPA